MVSQSRKINLFKRIISRRFSSSSSTSPSVELQPPEIPPFEYQPKPYNGLSMAQAFHKRKQFLGPSLFHYYQKHFKGAAFASVGMIKQMITKLVGICLSERVPKPRP